MQISNLFLYFCNYPTFEGKVFEEDKAHQICDGFMFDKYANKINKQIQLWSETLFGI